MLIYKVFRIPLPWCWKQKSEVRKCLSLCPSLKSGVFHLTLGKRS